MRIRISAFRVLVVTSAIAGAACDVNTGTREFHTPEGDKLEVQGQAEWAFGVRGIWQSARSCNITLPPPALGWTVPLVHEFRVVDSGNSELDVDALAQVAMTDRRRLEPADTELLIFFLAHDAALETDCGNLPFAWDGDYGFADPFAQSLPAISLDEATEVLRTTPRVQEELRALVTYQNSPEPPDGD